jgi:AraC-like DNA-binding protein
MGLESTKSHGLIPCSLLATKPPLAEVRGRSIYSRRLERLWGFVEKYFWEPDIRLADAARHSGVSPGHLNLLLQRFADTTFHDLLSRYRVEKCMALLHEKNYTLTEVYSRCGFNSATTFDRQFKKWVGCLPREYKRSITLRRETSSAEPAITLSEQSLPLFEETASAENLN